MHPDIGAVESHIDRDVADDSDALFVGVCTKLLPLLKELVLEEFEKIDVVL